MTITQNYAAIITATMEQRALKNVSNCLNTKIYSYLEVVKVMIYIYRLFIFQHLS
jgi:hypothetical protein